LCVNELGLECSETQLCHIAVFIDCVEQLHVSAFIGHRKVVLREISDYIDLKHLFTHCALRCVEKQVLKHFRDARDFNNIETLAGMKFLFLQGKALKEIHTILTEILSSFLPGRDNDLSAPL